MFTYAYPQLVCCPSYFKYQLKSIMVSTEKQEDNNHYYTFAKYGEQFYRRDENSHVRMMFDAALEYISGNTKLLSWSYGGVYTCLQCKDDRLLKSKKNILHDVILSIDRKFACMTCRYMLFYGNHIVTNYD
ncbi:unnamed protein product [Rotaria socialis]